MLECFCEGCNVLTCRDCQLSVHRDHGSHKWIGEKAEMMKLLMEDAVKQLQKFQLKLTNLKNIVHNVKTDESCNGLVFGVEKARQDIESRVELLTNVLKTQSQFLIDDLNRKANLYFTKLSNTERFVQNLQVLLSLCIHKI